MKLNVEYKKLSELIPYANNAKEHPQEQIEQIIESIEQFGMNDPIAVDKHNVIIEGHGRFEACKQMGIDEVPVISLDHLTEEQRKAYTLVHNQLTMNSGFDFEMLKSELEELSDFDMEYFGFDFEELEQEIENETEKYKEGQTEEVEVKRLEDTFIVPPFSVLDGRQGYWRERKQWWREKIGDDGQARESAQAFKGTDYFANSKYGFEINSAGGVSILDGCLAEVLLKWFTPQETGNKTFDCFAGDTVFGFISAYMGNEFTGIELREEQASFNNKSVKGMSAKYICDDGRNVLKHLGEESQDMLFSCPPYFDLEVYSDKENDASNQETYEDFIKILDTAFSESIKALKQNRFAVVVCGDIRDKQGNYYNFVGDIKNIFIKNGVKLYNDIVLLDPIGTACIRARKAMGNRKVTKVHQNVLVFYKGDTSKIKQEFYMFKEKEQEEWKQK